MVMQNCVISHEGCAKLTTAKEGKAAPQKSTCHFCGHFFHALGLVGHFQNVRHRGCVETENTIIALEIAVQLETGTKKAQLTGMSNANTALSQENMHK